MCADIRHQLAGINPSDAAPLVLLIVGAKVYFGVYGLIWVFTGKP